MSNADLGLSVGRKRTEMNMHIVRSLSRNGANYILRRVRSLRKETKGALLLEAAIAMVVAVLVGTALLGGLSTAVLDGALQFDVISR